jgi:ABC-type oligopeptide transport system ATPase subunit
MTAMLVVDNIDKTFRVGRRGKSTTLAYAVKAVSFEVATGSAFGLVGESGSGKSTTARIICRLIKPDSGTVMVDGVSASRDRASTKRFCRNVQMVFQDPGSSLNPRWKIRRLIREGMDIHGIGAPDERDDRVVELLRACGLSSTAMERFPHQFSGGQRQRLAIAGALAVEPKVLVLDEPVSALDVSIQAQILQLLTQLRQQRNLTYLLIAHDLAVVDRFCDHIGVMCSGELLETGTPEQVYRSPQHQYTRQLIASHPIPDPANPGRRRPLPAQL